MIHAVSQAHIMAAAAATDDTSRLMQLLQVSAPAMFHPKPQIPNPKPQTPNPHVQAIELCDEDPHLNQTALELAQRLHM